MPKINLCFLWHMHQPFYKNLVTGEYRLPWARLHALKDYFGMVKILDEFPQIHQTFNLVPSLLLQIDEYASGTARDPFMDAALKPAEQLTPAEKEFILCYFFQANEERVIRRYPRYAELFDLLQSYDRNAQRAAANFDTGMLRDLQILSQIAWFDEFDIEHDLSIRDLIAKGRDFAAQDQHVIAARERASLLRVLDVYRDTAARGQIELSASPYYHPILPLICDSNIANQSHPYISLPQQFAYPQDAEEQLRRSREYFRDKFNLEPRGMWPSEGAVSDQTFAIAASAGFEWTAADNSLLARSLDLPAAGDATYQPYRWQQGEHTIDVVFRDRRLSDFIALAYSRMDPYSAAHHFLAEVRKSCKHTLARGHDAFVAIILDGENAWESYSHNGRPFLRELYHHIVEAPDIRTCTISEALRIVPTTPLRSIFPGSWIDANMDVWIGAEEDNAAWEHLLKARKTFDAVLNSDAGASLPEQAKAAAFEELLIAEGSDWNWWYGPENPSANQGEFDQLYRDHLSNVYRLLGQEIPAELSKPISSGALAPSHQEPAGLIQPQIDGRLTTAREWQDAGRYRSHPGVASQHGQRSLLQELHYGSDGQNLFIRADLAEPIDPKASMDFLLDIRTAGGTSAQICYRPQTGQLTTDLPSGSVEVAAVEIFEARISMSALRVRLGDPVHVRLAVRRGDVLIGSIPNRGELELHSGSLAAYAY